MIKAKTFCLLALLLVVLAMTPPPLPRITPSTEVKGAQLLIGGAQRSARPTIAEKAIAWRYPSNIEPWRFVWSLERSLDGGRTWSMVRECDGDVSVPSLKPNELYRLCGRKWL